MKRGLAVKLGLLMVLAGGHGASAQLLDRTVDWELDDHLPGEVRDEGDKLVVTGNGAYGVRIEEGFGVASDEGFFAYTEITGSSTLQARLFPFDGQCSLMIRESAEDGASNFYAVELLFDEGAGVIGASALYRFRTGASGNVRIPLFDEEGNRIEDTGDGLWFRVTRVEPVDVFFGEYSPDGENWFIADSRVLKWAGESAAFGVASGSGANDDGFGEVEVYDLEFVSTPPVAQRSLSQQSYKGGETVNVAISVFVSGEDRNTATVVETVPEGWSVDGVTGGGTESNGTISWNLTDLPVGETVLEYGATAPAEPGDFANWTGNVAESVDILGPDTLPLLDISGGARAEDGLVSLYLFNEGIGLTVNDSSPNGEPMNLIIEDPGAVEWGPGYLETTGVNQVATEGPAEKIIQACKASNELTVEGWVKTSDIGQNGPARMITCSIDASNRNFTLGQGRFGAGGDRFEMRYRTTDNNEWQVDTLNGTFSEALTHVVWTRAADGAVAAYVNNRPETTVFQGGDSIEEVTGDFSNWDDSYRFGVGNEISAPRQWLGQFYLVALYDKALSADEVSQNYNAGPFVGDDTGVPRWMLY